MVTGHRSEDAVGRVLDKSHPLVVATCRPLGEHQPPSGPEGTTEVGEGAGWVRDVTDAEPADHRREGRVAERAAADVGAHEPDAVAGVVGVNTTTRSGEHLR